MLYLTPPAAAARLLLLLLLGQQQEIIHGIFSSNFLWLQGVALKLNV